MLISLYLWYHLYLLLLILSILWQPIVVVSQRRLVLVDPIWIFFVSNKLNLTNGQKIEMKYLLPFFGIVVCLFSSLVNYFIFAELFFTLVHFGFLHFSQFFIEWLFGFFFCCFFFQEIPMNRNEILIIYWISLNSGNTQYIPVHCIGSYNSGG